MPSSGQGGASGSRAAQSEAEGFRISTSHRGSDTRPAIACHLDAAFPGPSPHRPPPPLSPATSLAACSPREREPRKGREVAVPSSALHQPSVLCTVRARHPVGSTERAPSRTSPAECGPSSERCSPTSFSMASHLPTSESGLALFNGCIVFPSAAGPATRSAMSAEPWGSSQEPSKLRRQRGRRCQRSRESGRGEGGAVCTGEQWLQRGGGHGRADRRQLGGLARSWWGEGLACCPVDHVTRAG